MIGWAASFVLGWTLGVAPSPAQDVASGAAQREREAVREELARGLEGLRIDGADRAYALRATLQRASLLYMVGRYGALSESQLVRRAIGEVEARVGTLERDSTQLFASGAREVFGLPLVADPAATRRAVWLASDTAFKGALESLDVRTAVEASLNTPRDVPDWSAVPVDRATGLVPDECDGDAAQLERARQLLTTDRSKLEVLTRTLSEGFSAAPWVEGGAVILQAAVAERTDIDTEGLAHCEVRVELALAVIAKGRALDGLVIPRAAVLHLRGEEWVGADRWKLLASRGRGMVARTIEELKDLVDAPRLEEDYDGPLILSPYAAAQMLAVTVVPHASGTPAPLSEYGPMTELQPHWLDSFGAQVMPSWLDISDEPQLAGGFGSYAEDVQGVGAREVHLVRGGVLRDFWMTRHPNAVTRTSNGRARGTLSLMEGTSASNLFVRSTRAGSGRAELEADALARAREDGYDHIYVLESLRDESVLGTNEIDEAAGYGTGRRVDLPAPATLVRVGADGSRELVRGGLLTSASLRVLRRIRAVGDEAETVRFRIPPGVSGGLGAAFGVAGLLTDTVNVQVTTPAWLVEGLELVPVRGDAPHAPRLLHPLRRGPRDP